MNFRAIPELPAPDHLTDEQLIHYHITEALREDRPIDHATARAIASQLHGGQTSPLYALASSGAVVDGLSAELDTWREDNETRVEVAPWLDALDKYLTARDDPSRIEGWSQLWPSQPRTREPEDDEQARQDLFERISAAGVTTLGQVATVVGGTVELADGGQDERDTFHWADAAQWSPAEVALSILPIRICYCSLNIKP